MFSTYVHCVRNANDSPNTEETTALTGLLLYNSQDIKSWNGWIQEKMLCIHNGALFCHKTNGLLSLAT